MVVMNYSLESLLLVKSEYYISIGSQYMIRLFIISYDRGAFLGTGFESCHNVTIDQNVTFTVNVRLNECTEEFRSGSRYFVLFS